MFIEVRTHAGHLRLEQRINAERLDERVHAAGGNAGEVAVGDHGDQCRLGALTALQQPVREVRARARLGDGNVDRADSGVQLTVLLAVTLRNPVRGRFAPFGATYRVRVSINQEQR